MSDLQESTEEHQYSNESFEDALSDGEEELSNTNELIRVYGNKNETELQNFKKQLNCETYIRSSNNDESITLPTSHISPLPESLDYVASIKVKYSKNFLNNNQLEYIKLKNEETNLLFNAVEDEVKYFNKNNEFNNSKLRYNNSKKEHISHYYNKSKNIHFNLNKKIERKYSATNYKITDNRKKKVNNNFINYVQDQNNENPIYKKYKNEEFPKVSSNWSRNEDCICLERGKEQNVVHNVADQDLHTVHHIINAKTGKVDKSVDLVDFEKKFLMCLSMEETDKDVKETLAFVKEGVYEDNKMNSVDNVRYFIKSSCSKEPNLPGQRSTKLFDELHSTNDSLNNKEDFFMADVTLYSNIKSTYTPTSFNTEDYTLHVDLLRAHSSSSDRIRSKNVGRKSFSFSNEQAREIERQNNILLKKMMSIKSPVTSNIKKFSPLPANNKSSSAAINRKKQQRQIDMDNTLLKRKLEAIGSRRRVFE